MCVIIYISCKRTFTTFLIIKLVLVLFTESTQVFFSPKGWERYARQEWLENKVQNWDRQWVQTCFLHLSNDSLATQYNNQTLLEVFWLAQGVLCLHMEIQVTRSHVWASVLIFTRDGADHQRRPGMYSKTRLARSTTSTRRKDTNIKKNNNNHIFHTEIFPRVEKPHEELWG